MASKTDWKSIIKEQEASGMTIKEFCKEKGISENTFYYNQRNIRNEEKEDKKPRKAKTKTIRPNDFVEMRAALAPAASDVLDIIFCIMDSNAESPDGLTYIINTKEYDGMFINSKGNPMSSKRVYERIKNGIESLYDIDLEFTEDTDAIKKGISFRVLSAKMWNEGTGKLGIQLTPMFKAIMEEQRKKNSYSLYELRYQFALNGEYSKRLYPMLMRFKNTGQRYDNAAELRKKLGIPLKTTQSRYKSILAKSIEEINEITDIDVKMETKGHGVSGGTEIDTIAFEIERKSMLLDEDITEDQKECIEYTKKTFMGYISEMDAPRIAKAAEYDKAKITNAFEVMKGYKKRIADTTGFILAALSNDWQQGSSKEKEKAKNTFTEYEQRGYNLEALECVLLNQSNYENDEMSPERKMKYEEALRNLEENN